jgi:hypothetical protein
MTTRLQALLRQHGIAATTLAPITNGAGGAFVYALEDNWVVKYASLPDLDNTIREQFMNEYEFYRSCANDRAFCIPEIELQASTDTEILLVMKKYAAIRHAAWDEALQKKAMRLCARINAMGADCVPSRARTRRGSDNFLPLSESLADWLRLHEKHPGCMDAALLHEMYERYDGIVRLQDDLQIPYSVCHGDFHPDNFLLREGELLLCDWQSVGIGRGIGDVAFFISRGKDMGLRMDPDILISAYHDALREHTGMDVCIQDLRRYAAISEFMVSFRHWAEYLQESSTKRVMRIYEPMVMNFRLAAQ